MDVMVSDLPHIQYHPRTDSTQEQEENRMIIARHERELIKEKGIGGVSGLKLGFSNKDIIDGNSLLMELEKKG